MKKRVFVTRRIPEIGINLLKQRNDIELDIYDDDEKIPRRKLLKRVRGAHVILSILTENIDAEVMNAAGDQLEMIANYAVGFNNIDVKEAKKRSIAVSNAPGPEIVESVAEHTVALILALSHRIVEGDRFMRGGKYSAWGPLLLLGNDLCGKTLGIIGTGRIGEGVAKALHLGFGVNILYHDLERNKKLEKSCKAKYRTKETLLKQADIVSLHVPLLPATRHLISKKELKMMKETAILINTARGPVVDEAALLDALVNGSIAGAGLDVYECEPHLGCSMYARKLFRK
ncbi:MAG: D-glycerate dehydrogenase, partial [bacterium]|nr:D-glycerate dehydrogenase [bacterium]